MKGVVAGQGGFQPEAMTPAHYGARTTSNNYTICDIAGSGILTGICISTWTDLSWLTIYIDGVTYIGGTYTIQGATMNLPCFVRFESNLKIVMGRNTTANYTVPKAYVLLD